MENVRNVNLYLCTSKTKTQVACVADELPRYSPSANQRPKACSAPRVLPGFSIMGSNWLFHLAVLFCTVIGRADLVEPWLRSRRIPVIHKINSSDHGISVLSGEKQFEVSQNLPE